MKLQAIFLCLALGFLSIFLGAGCATAGPRVRYLAEIPPSSIANLSAYYADNAVEIRYPLKGKDDFAFAVWQPPAADDGDFRCQLATLKFKSTKHAAYRAAFGKKDRLTVLGAAEWKKLLTSVFAGLTPAKPNHGALLLSQLMDVILYRDASGNLKVVRLEDKPRDVVVDRTFSDSEFSRETIKLLAASIQSIEPNQNRFLLVTDEASPFVLVDIQKRLIVFLNYPADPESEPSQLPGWLVLRALNSLVIKSFVLTAIKNPITLVGRGLWHLGSSGMTMADTLPSESGDPPPPLYEGPGMDLNAWEKELDSVVSARRYHGKAQFYVDGREFFPELVKSLEDAKESVDLMVYIFGTDNYATKIADVLKQISATRRVRVLTDDIGSLFAIGAPPSAIPPGFHPPGDIKSYLESGSKVHVRVSSDPWLATDHRKCIIIDNRQAYVGGMNIGWVYRYQWHDLMVGLTGQVVGRIENDYRKAWAFSGPFGDLGYAGALLFEHEHLPRKPEPGDIDIRVLRTATAKLQIYHAELAAIRRARRYIYIENAYFNDDTILRELVAARLRGVDVRVILPAENDVGIMQIGNLVMANEMLQHGIRVYLYPGMTHVKAAIFDGWACVGSANLEKMSLRVSQEMDVAFSDPKTVDDLKNKLFVTDFARAEEIKKAVALNWFAPFLKALGNQL